MEDIIYRHSKSRLEANYLLRLIESYKDLDIYNKYGDSRYTRSKISGTQATVTRLNQLLQEISSEHKQRTDKSSS